MRTLWRSALLAGVSLVCAVACGSSDPVQVAMGPAPAAPPAQEAPHPVKPRTAEAPDLDGAVEHAVADVGTLDLGLSVLDLETGARSGSRADVPFRTASLSKLIIAVDVLSRGDVDDEDRDRLRRALSLSDDEAMNALWDVHDGMGAVDRVSELVGLTTTHAPEDSSQWGDVVTSAEDLVRLYHYVLTALPESERDFIVSALTAAPRTAADGFDQDFGLLAPGLGAYAKQGWMWYQPADLYLHSAGVVAGRYVVVLLTVHSGVDEETAREQVTAVAKSLVSGLVPNS
ncbi:serine hydrolase [Saccharothrix variisporea]|uniref:serine hydrolase n=1 Tax=Saccharothrix variisporea TaxID=543527 RepID=UPI0011C424CE|nr:serine hydrolase [Saccharothrix variisporea]